MKNSKIDACVYILTCMLQRLEISKPGYLSDLIAGIKNDRCEVSGDADDSEYIEEIFSETLSILNRAQQQLAI